MEYCGFKEFGARARIPKERTTIIQNHSISYYSISLFVYGPSRVSKSITRLSYSEGFNLLYNSSKFILFNTHTWHNEHTLRSRSLLSCNRNCTFICKCAQFGNCYNFLHVSLRAKKLRSARARILKK